VDEHAFYIGIGIIANLKLNLNSGLIMRRDGTFLILDDLLIEIDEMMHMV
jgi:hypothetical protein